MSDKADKSKNISVSATPLSPHTKALLKAGERLITESVETGREFCKFMIGITLTAIPIYIGLIKAFIPKDTIISDIIGLVWVFPIGLLILAAVIFLVGYMPNMKRISLVLPDNIEEILTKTINRRFRFSIGGFVIFCAAILSAVVVFVGL